MSRRTDRCPLEAPPAVLKRMAGCDQVRPSHAREALAHGLLVFGLCPDMKWRQVDLISVDKPHPTSPTIYRIVFKDSSYSAGYVRYFTKDGILLVEVPPGRAVSPPARTPILT